MKPQPGFGKACVLRCHLSGICSANLLILKAIHQFFNQKYICRYHILGHTKEKVRIGILCHRKISGSAVIVILLFHPADFNLHGRQTLPIIFCGYFFYSLPQVAYREPFRFRIHQYNLRRTYCLLQQHGK